MLKLRLKRYGKKREPNYRIIVIESRTRRQTRPLAELGFYNPRTKETVLETGDILTWLRRGAQPTETMGAILRKAGVFEMLKANKSAGDDGVSTIRISPVARVAAIVEEVEEESATTPENETEAETAAALEEGEEVTPEPLEEAPSGEATAAPESTEDPVAAEPTPEVETTAAAEPAPAEPS